MIAQFLNRQVVLDQLEAIREQASEDRQRIRAQGGAVDEHDLVDTELAAAGAREKAVPSSQSSFAPPVDDRRGASGPPPLDDYAFISSDPTISLLQSALDELYDRPAEAAEVAAAPPPDDRRGVGDEPMVTNKSLKNVPVRNPTSDRRVFDRFSITDAQWVRSKIAEGIRLFRRRREFNENPGKPVALDDNARLILVGDWGSGLPRAQKVAEQMRLKIDEARRDGRQVHVVHLGDVYYSGWGHEYRKRFLPSWPVRAEEAETVGSWTLNGNHDMYAGGHAYFDVALGDPRFKRWQVDDSGKATSFFSIVGRNWQILALDSSWDDGGLKDPQARWLRDSLKGAGGRKTLLLSHHQLFSAYEKGAKDLGEKVTPVLADHPVASWFWGHEHRCMCYKRHQNVGFGCCLGDGGVPVYQWHGAEDKYPDPGSYESRRVFKKGLERWGVMGFASLDFNGGGFDVRYVDETGNEHHKETVA